MAVTDRMNTAWRAVCRHRLWLSLCARVVLAGFWLWAGLSKVGDPTGSIAAVKAYRLLPDAAASVVGAALPMVEIALGLTLLLGFAVRAGAVVSAVLQLMFIIGIATAAARGLRIDCGCFGGGGELSSTESTRYTAEIGRDIWLLLVAGMLAIWPMSRFGLDYRHQRREAKQLHP